MLWKQQEFPLLPTSRKQKEESKTSNCAFIVLTLISLKQRAKQGQESSQP